MHLGADALVHARSSRNSGSWLGAVVTVATGNTGRGSSSEILKRDNNIASRIWASAMANVAPMQIRGPAPNGRNAPPLVHGAGLPVKRSGMNAVGRSQNLR